MALRLSEFAEMQKKRLLKSLAKGFIEQSIENEILNKSENMEKYNYTIIEEWWRHLGLWDRQEVSGYKIDNHTTEVYLEVTDEWWDSLTDDEKKQVYEDFFAEY